LTEPALAQVAARAPAAGSSDARLRTVLDRMYEAQLERNPEEATAAGLDTGINAARKTRLTDRSPEARRRRLTEARRELQQVTAVPRGRLSAASRIDQDVIRYALGREIEELSGYVSSPGAPYAISQLTGAYVSVPDFLDNQHSVKTRGDAESYLLRLNAFGTAIDQDLARQRARPRPGSFRRTSCWTPLSPKPALSASPRPRRAGWRVRWAVGRERRAWRGTGRRRPRPLSSARSIPRWTASWRR
jgi:uncharacterized protein (DUF885 family)